MKYHVNEIMPNVLEIICLFLPTEFQKENI